ncbi:MAG: hypothetical protein K2K17_08305 [Lachnospiraceae bacterium]|nr:hypothetical protein [Lachnospiraceae bacterium]
MMEVKHVIPDYSDVKERRAKLQEQYVLLQKKLRQKKRVRGVADAGMLRETIY